MTDLAGCVRAWELESLGVVVVNSSLVTGDPDQHQHGEPGGGRHQQQSCHRGRRCPAHTAPQIIACIEEGSSVDSGNLESIQKELEEELKGSARRSSGLWRRGIVGQWEGGEHGP